MEFFEVIKARRSVRKFQSEPVPEEVIEKALAAALLAPNSSNLQAWEFYWVRSSEKKQSLAKACFSQGAAATASDLIVCVARLDSWKKHRDYLVEQFNKPGAKTPSSVFDYYQKLIPFVYFRDILQISAVVKKLLFTIIGLFRPVPRGPAFKSEMYEVAVKSAALACENFMLAMAAQGYGSCPMEGFDACRVKSIIDLSGSAKVVMVIGVGKVDPAGVFGEQIRVPQEWVVKRL